MLLDLLSMIIVTGHVYPFALLVLGWLVPVQVYIGYLVRLCGRELSLVTNNLAGASSPKTAFASLGEDIITSVCKKWSVS